MTGPEWGFLKKDLHAHLVLGLVEAIPPDYKQSGNN